MSDTVSLRTLADFMCERRALITTQWLDRVREANDIPSADDLPRQQLMDHLPAIFDHLADELRAATPELAKGEAKSDARAHGDHRWQQEYELAELLREIGLLRAVFMRHLTDFQAEYPAFIGEREWAAQEIIHSYFDRLAVVSGTQFVARQQAELTQANSALKEANGALEEANAKIAEFNERLLQQDERRLQMLRTISHEVRNHLNAISVVVMILGKETNPSVCHEYVELLSRNLGEVTTLMNQLLDFTALLSGGEKVEIATCDLVDLHEELALFLHEMARTKGLIFNGHVDPQIGSVLTDRHKLRRIAMNLATNAIKYTTEGAVTLAFRTGADGKWLMEVNDTGPGIPPEERDRIFEEFHRVAATHGGQPGAGLGLAITQQLVQLLGGDIELESEVGRGTTFTVRLLL